MTGALFFSVKRALAALCCVALLAVLVPLSAVAQSDDEGEVVRVGWYESVYNQMDSSGRRSGYAYEYERKIAAYTGWSYDYVEGSWGELLTMLENGEIDILSGVSYTEERAEKMLYPSYSMGSEEYYIYISEKNMEDFDESFTYFNGKRIGVNKNSIQEGLFREWEKQHGIEAEIVELLGAEAESIGMLIDGELDGYITLDDFLGIDTILPVAKIGSSELYFAVSKSRTDLLNELDGALGKIQNENRYYNEELFAKYTQSSSANIFLDIEEKDWLSEHGAVRVGYLDNYLAYCDEDDKSGELTGALMDFLDRASGCFANAEIDFESHSYSTVSDALDALHSGEVDCVFPASFSDYDGENFGVSLTPEITRAALYIVVKSYDQKDLVDKKQASVAVVEGDTNHESVMKDYYPNWQKVYCADVEECLKAVANGRADCFLISSYRYNSIIRLCEKYSLASLDTGKDIPFCFAVSEGDAELYSILSKSTNIIPDSYVNNTLTRYFSEEGKPTMLDLIKQNIFIVITVIVIMAAMLLLIIIQRRLIKAEKRANENRLLADNLSKRVYIDSLTSVRNKGGYNDYIEVLQKRVEKGEVKEYAVCMFDCDDLKYINDEFGHEKGDEYLKSASSLICRIFRHSPVFRIGGDEFTAVLQSQDYESRDELFAQFKKECRTINDADQYDWQKVNISYGIAQYDPETDRTVADTASRADEKMYENKRKRKRKAGRDVR